MSSRSKSDHGIGSRKRKERDVACTTQQPPPPPTTNLSKSPSAAAGAGGVHIKNNWLLAGYLAHEFLTGGTILDQKWDPSRAEANPITPRNHVRRGGAAIERGGGPTPTKTVPPPQEKIYADVSNLLMKSSEGIHMEGIVNPTQLAKWLHSSAV